MLLPHLVSAQHWCTDFSLKDTMQGSQLVLTGIGMGYLFSALGAVIQFFAEEYKLAEIVQWTFGLVSKADWTGVGISAGILAVVSGVFYVLSIPLDVMANNDDEVTASLGINPRKIRLAAGIAAVFLTAAIISFTGVIGFVGLVAPHMARMLAGSIHRRFLPVSAGLGAALLLYADGIGRYILYPVVIPMGIVVSFVGVPLFIHLIRTSGKRVI